MRSVNIHEVFQHRMLYLLHHDDTPQTKLLYCREWLKELPEYPSLAAAIYPIFAACQEALQGIVAPRPRRGMVFRNNPQMELYRRRMAELEAEAKAKARRQ